MRKLILTYTLEPAGSHGVWGLDDHAFLPYIFGSAQLARPIGTAADAMPQDGSAPRAPKPADVVKPATVAVQRERNMYFSAIGFINDVKRGPFWEHSPILYDVSGIKEGWGKINKGMIKMYNAEVLSKFPVVQHFPFGSLFAWDEDPLAAAPVQTVHMANQPLAAAATAAGMSKHGVHTAAGAAPTRAGGTGAGAGAATATATGMPQPSTAAPWVQATRMPGAGPGPYLPGTGIPYSRVPAAAPAPGGSSMRLPAAPSRAPFARGEVGRPGAPESDSTGPPSAVTRAPWAK